MLLLLLLLLLLLQLKGGEGGWLQGLLHVRAGSRTNVAPFTVQGFLRVPSTSNERKKRHGPSIGSALVSAPKAFPQML